MLLKEVIEMNRFVKAAVLATASVAAILAPISISAASAGGWGYRYHYWGHGPSWGGPGPYWGGRPWGYRRHHNRDAWAAGAIGLAAGAIIGGALSQPTYAAPIYQQPIYQQPPVVYYPQTQTRYVTRYVTYPRAAGYQPWTRGWYNYCSSRYRSFNPSTGTYRGYDGQNHFCAAN